MIRVSLLCPCQNPVYPAGPSPWKEEMVPPRADCGVIPYRFWRWTQHQLCLFWHVSWATYLTSLRLSLCVCQVRSQWCPAPGVLQQLNERMQHVSDFPLRVPTWQRRKTRIHTTQLREQMPRAPNATDSWDNLKHLCKCVPPNKEHVDGRCVCVCVCVCMCVISGWLQCKTPHPLLQPVSKSRDL